jgi:hypothetical protein
VQAVHGREGHRQDVIYPEVKRLELGFQVAASGETQDRRRASRQGVRGPEPLEQRGAVLVVHVDHGHVRAPLGQDRLGLRQAACGPNNEQAVVEGQFDEVHDELVVMEHHRPARVAFGCAHMNVRHRSTPQCCSL